MQETQLDSPKRIDTYQCRLDASRNLTGGTPDTILRGNTEGHMARRKPTRGRRSESSSKDDQSDRVSSYATNKGSDIRTYYLCQNLK